MGRQERPLSPSGGALDRFASGLRGVRRAAGSPGYRALARRAGYSASALASAANGRTVPSLAVILVLCQPPLPTGRVSRLGRPAGRKARLGTGTLIAPA